MFVVVWFILVSVSHPVSSADVPYTVYELQGHLKIPVIPNESFVICPATLTPIDWPYMVFGDFLISIGYETLSTLGSFEPKFKVFRRLPKQARVDLSNIQDLYSSAYELNDYQSDDVIFSSNSKAFFTLTPTPETCFVVYDFQPNHRYSGLLRISSTLEFDRNRLIQSLTGLLIVICAKSLANSIIFYYFSGVSVIVCSSLLLILIILIRLMPMRRTGAMLQSIVFLFSGTLGLTFMFMDYFRSTVTHLVVSNWELVLGYVSIVSLFSLIILYWLQIPDKLVENYPRTKVLTTVLFRVVGSLLFVYSMHLPVLNFTDSTILQFLDHKTAFPGASDVLKKYSDLLVRLFVVICVNIVSSILQRTVSYSSEKSKFNSKIPSVQNHITEVPPAFQHYMPGSPWAASSPRYQSVGFMQDRNTSFGFRPHFSDYDLIKSNPWTSEYPSVHKRQSSVSQREYHQPFKHEILTDDED